MSEPASGVVPMRKLGVGIVGNGMATRVFHTPYVLACDALELRAVVDRKPDALPPAPGVAIVPSLDALLEDEVVELVVIATPTATHGALARQVIEAGRHLVVEKPFALDLAEARALVALAERRGIAMAAFHNRRWDSDFLTVRRAIEDGLAGEVLHFESHFDRFRPQPRDRWREDGSAGSGVWLDLGPHLVDQALLLFGMPQRVSADIAALRPGGLSADWAHVVLHYPGRRIVLHASMTVAGGEPRFRVHGTRATLIKTQPDPQEAQSGQGLRPGDEGWGVDTDPLLVVDGEGATRTVPAETGHQQAFYEAMARACRGLGPVPTQPVEVLGVQTVLEAALVSAREGRVVETA